MIYLVLISGIFNIFMGAITTTKNLQSAIVFRALPLILGVGSVIYALNDIGVL